MLQGNFHLMQKLLRLLSEIERVVQVTCKLEGDEELHDFVPGKRKLKKDHFKVRHG